MSLQGLGTAPGVMETHYIEHYILELHILFYIMEIHYIEHYMLELHMLFYIFALHALNVEGESYLSEVLGLLEQFCHRPVQRQTPRVQRQTTTTRVV